jgi:hypothetical protein
MAREGMSGGYRDYIDSLVSEIPIDRSRSSITELFAAYIAEELATSR